MTVAKRLVLALLCALSGCADVQVLTEHNDDRRTGANLHETSLKPTNVNPRSFGLLGTYNVRGKVFAQPLFATLGGRHMLYVATAANMVYAFDADQPGTLPLRSQDLGSNRLVSAKDVYPDEAPDIEPALGIISTPVIDMATATLYCVAMTKVPDSEKDSHGGNPYVWTLRALDIDSLEVKNSVEIQHFDFNSRKQLQRAALTLANGRVYTAWSSFGDRTPSDDPADWNGWVIAYRIVDARGSLAPAESFKVAPRKHQGGIWHSGGGAAVDASGNLYVITGNGHSDDGDAGSDFDSSDVKLDSELRVSDYYTPSFRGTLNGIQPRDDNILTDLDLSVSGPMIPSEWIDSRGQPVRKLLHGSKQGILYNVNRDGMGHLLSPSNQDPVQMVQVFTNRDPGDQMKAQHIHTTPVYWENSKDRRVFVASDWGLGIRAYQLEDNGRLDPLPVASASADDFGGFSVTQMSLSADSKSDGILWMVGCVGCVDDLHHGPAAWHDKLGALLAYDARSLTWLYSAPVGKYPRFNAPTIANGRVYVPTFSEEVVVFGLRPVSNPAELPKSCRGWSYGCGNEVEMMCDEPTATPIDIEILPGLGFVAADPETPWVYGFNDSKSGATGAYRPCLRGDHQVCGDAFQVSFGPFGHDACAPVGSGGAGNVPGRPCGPGTFIPHCPKINTQ
jgi:hypothetical protein